MKQDQTQSLSLDLALHKLIDRVESLEQEKAERAEDIKDVFTEAKGAGYDVGIMRAVIRRRKMDPAAREEMDATMSFYEKALGMWSPD